MPRSSKKQGRYAFKCDHGDTLDLYRCLSLLRTLSTAQRTDAFRLRQLAGLSPFVVLCVNEPCSHFRRSFIDDLLPGVCQASAKALQLLHSSAGSFQQQSMEVLEGVDAVLASLYTCTTSVNTCDQLLAAVTAAGGYWMIIHHELPMIIHSSSNLTRKDRCCWQL